MHCFGSLGSFKFLIIFSVLINYVNSLYFHLTRNERKCFIEEMPDETIFQGIYDVMVSKGSNSNEFIKTPAGFGMFVQVTNSEKKEVLSRNYGSSGKFSFTTDTPGEYTICMGSNATSSYNILFTNNQKLKVNFKIKVGEHTQNYREIAQKDELTEMELHLRRMIEQSTQIAREQNFQRYRETKFRSTSEDVSSRVLKWAVLQLIVLIAVGLYQMRHLRKFFEAKKLV